MSKTINSFALSGEVKKFGHNRPTQNGQLANWGRLWILAQLDPVKIPDDAGNLQQVQDNVLFLNFELSFGTGDFMERTTSIVMSSLKEGSFVFIPDLRIAEIQRSRKLPDGTWEQYKDIGAKASILDLSIAQSRFGILNNGTVYGKVEQQVSNKVVIEDVYVIPGRGRHTRRVPVVLPYGMTHNMVGRMVYATCQMCGKNLKNEEKVFAVASQAVVI